MVWTSSDEARAPAENTDVGAAWDERFECCCCNLSSRQLGLAMAALSNFWNGRSSCPGLCMLVFLNNMAEM